MTTPSDSLLLPRPGCPPPSPGMLEAVRADIAGIEVSKVPGGYTYQALALWLAGVIDSRGSDDGPSMTAKLAERLTVVMEKLTRKGGDDTDDFTDFSNSISVPVVGE